MVGRTHQHLFSLDMSHPQKYEPHWHRSKSNVTMTLEASCSNVNRWNNAHRKLYNVLSGCSVVFVCEFGASFLWEQSQQILCITLHNLCPGAKSKAPLVENPNETCKPLKKALENWIKLAIRQSGPAAMQKQKRICEAHIHVERKRVWGGFPFFHSCYSRELLYKDGHTLQQVSLFSIKSSKVFPTTENFCHGLLSLTPANSSNTVWIEEDHDSTLKRDS